MKSTAAARTQGFFPNTYVDISAVVEKKKAGIVMRTPARTEKPFGDNITRSWPGGVAGKLV
jgi:hypothetical protein